MLFASLESEHEGTLTTAVGGFAHDATRHLAHELFGGTHVADVWSAPCHRNAKRLTFANCDVGTPFAWSFEQGKISSDGIHDEQRLALMASVGNAREVFDDAISVGLLNDDASHATLVEELTHSIEIGSAISLRNGNDIHAMEVGVGFNHFCNLWVYCGGNQHLIAFLCSSYCHHGSFGCGCRAIIERGIGNVHACELSHHALVFENVVESALRYLSLIRSVAGEEFATAGNLRYQRRCVVVVDTSTGKAH